jgi:hypothetical protein
MAVRSVKRLVKAKPTLEGAGVRLRRAFGFGATSDYDPFLLLDDFRNERPEDYLPGFPWHPHRGIETITYVLAGTVEHGDSMGNRGSIGAGDIQWMTAGRGIIHQEMPTGDAGGRMHGFQLWANLPSSLKMTVPRYQDVKAKVHHMLHACHTVTGSILWANLHLLFGCLLFHSQRVGWERTTSPHCPQQLMASCS